MKSLSDDKPRPGLRERKKAKTRATIQAHAIRLFRERGFAATTVEQVAEAAEVAPSTVFRYFPTKEDLVIRDDYDPIIWEAFRSQPPGLTLVQAWRNALHEIMDSLESAERALQWERGLLLLTVPEVWAASLGNITQTLDTIIRLSAERVGRPPDDPAVRSVAGAMFGVMLTAMFDWLKNSDMDIMRALDEGFDQLDSGLRL